MAGQELMRVYWDDKTREWEVYARSNPGADWSVWDGTEDELDALLALGRDTMTGG
jgi:hypothetical protein